METRHVISVQQRRDGSYSYKILGDSRSRYLLPWLPADAG